MVVKGIYLSLILSYLAIFLFSIFSIKIIAKLLNIKSSVLSAFVLVFCVIGSYALNNCFVDVLIAITFGLLGYWMRREDFPLGPMTLALVLGKMIEQKLGGALKLSDGSLLPFVTRPVSLVLLIATVLFTAYSIWGIVKKRKIT